ncbi:BhlA/UviB family holin-like peptide [Cytobacillus firmus]|nr:BhlA/UviB family holin-like peptide [Cytobacillus firmus]
MEQLLLEFGLKDGIFVGLFIWLLIYTFKKSDAREDKLYTFLDDMKVEFAKLVGSYEKLSNDVAEIKEDLEAQKSEKGNDK